MSFSRSISFWFALFLFIVAYAIVLDRIFSKRKSKSVSSETKRYISFLGILLIESLVYGKTAYSTIILSINSLISSK